jgi:hypothetical protein
MTLDYHYVQVGGSVTVISPAVWSVFTSKRYGFRMAYPPDWDASVSDKSEDVFISPIDAENVFAYRYKSDGFTLNQFVQELVRYNKAHRYPLRTNVAFTLAGKKARLLTFRGALSDGTKVVAYSVLALNGVWVYELDWFSPVGLEVTDLATFKEMLGTFAYKL